MCWDFFVEGPPFSHRWLAGGQPVCQTGLREMDIKKYEARFLVSRLDTCSRPGAEIHPRGFFVSDEAFPARKFHGVHRKFPVARDASLAHLVTL